jgi:integrase/recombinase XerD
MEETVTLLGMVYKQSDHIAIVFDKKPVLIKAIRKCRGCRWSQSRKCWILPMSRNNFEQVNRIFANIARIDSSHLRQYLINRRKSELSDNLNQGPGTTAKNNSYKRNESQALQEIHPEISPVNAHVMPAMLQQLQLKSYSGSTIKTYMNELAQLVRLMGANPVDALTEAEIKRYLVYCFGKLKLSENTLHSRINALKFYFEKVLQRDRFFWNIPRPKKHLQLPKLLNEDELSRLFNSLKNKKHKAMLFTAYSAGLRVSEIVNLKLADIDSVRIQIFVEKSKGKKDRYVNLSPVLLDILRDYVSTYTPKPRVFLFESEQTLTAYPSRTVQQIFTNAKIRARVGKKVGIHSLRHSFATHLLDKGTDIRYIKDLLGHFNIRTTERYLHVSKAQLVNIESPFDDLFRSKKIDW